MAYFVITTALMKRLISSAPARVVNTWSDAIESATLDFDDLQPEKPYQERSLLEWARCGGPGFKVYGRSKLCNILLTLNCRGGFRAHGVTANCFHPGFVATRLGDEAGGLISFSIRIGKPFALSPEEGARTLVHLASSPKVARVTAKHFYKCQPVAAITRGARSRHRTALVGRVRENSKVPTLSAFADRAYSPGGPLWMPGYVAHYESTRSQLRKADDNPLARRVFRPNGQYGVLLLKSIP
jgi:NAD(P)-dependent dehydrogenase (short-subunit alcohol dehydrogenase family)